MHTDSHGLGGKKGVGTRLFVGLMSGTSVDGVDAALVEVTGKEEGRYGARVVAHVEHSWPKKVRERLLGVMAPAAAGTAEICELNVVVAKEFARAAEKVLDVAAVHKGEVAAIGSHGQTVCHLPAKGKGAKWGMGSTLQLGDVSVIATLTGITTVGNFRPADMAVGGQGAPLVPWTDDALLADDTKARCVQNIGGIANVTYLPPRESAAADGRNVIAFDTGPGNMLLDAVVSLGTRGRQRFDRGGRLAAKGELLPGLWRELQGHAYFGQKPPKSTGRELFGVQMAREILKKHRRARLEDIAHTLTRLTAWSIVDAYLHFLPELPDEVIVCGGGADNPTLMRMLGEELGVLRSDFTRPEPPRLRRIAEFGIPNKAKEAASFALLAAATLDGVPANLPSVTGAGRGVVLGVVARG
jgi:anhydro-N-acetylmuramic acid kinase